jgi:hypothetical protein
MIKRKVRRVEKTVHNRKQFTHESEIFSVTDGILRSQKNCLPTNKPPSLLQSCIQHTVVMIRWKYYGNGSTSKSGTDTDNVVQFHLCLLFSHENESKEGREKEAGNWYTV